MLKRTEQLNNLLSNSNCGSLGSALLDYYEFDPVLKVAGTLSSGKLTKSLSRSANSPLELQLYECRSEACSDVDFHHKSSKKLFLAFFRGIWKPITGFAGRICSHLLSCRFGRFAVERSLISINCLCLRANGVKAVW